MAQKTQPKKVSSGNRSESRGHWTAGQPRNHLEPDELRQLQELADWIAVNRQPHGRANPRSVKRMAAETGLSHGTIRHYLAGTYVPETEAYRAMMAWWEVARTG